MFVDHGKSARGFRGFYAELDFAALLRLSKKPLLYIVNALSGSWGLYNDLGDTSRNKRILLDLIDYSIHRIDAFLLANKEVDDPRGILE